MILVTGGCFQGKTTYACETFGIDREDTADGMNCLMEQIYQAKLLYHFHEYIHRLMEMGQEFVLEELKEKNPDIILVTNELGYGVVPIDRFDRAYREKTGRICCQIAKEAKEVHRVVCGIGTVIKHD
ncbi:MAG: bifunctional adenosylcobinamide kinase/adenosylcobinamide-phosphate guanylyltransferase [Lachnospiraceae bacterium]|nr:bifunctional adenosylcobinamide kinase/adenosylcobinamide-phosphate guanylyltransferase [Lachnospiraceae bacterium]